MEETRYFVCFSQSEHGKELSSASNPMEKSDHSLMVNNNVINAESEAWINSLNKNNKASLLEWMERCNVNLIQVNSQRE